MNTEIEAMITVMQLMVDNPSSMRIQVIKNNGSLSIQLSAKDIRELIGREGRNARSLRIILNAMVSKFGERVGLNMTGAPLSPETAE